MRRLSEANGWKLVAAAALTGVLIVSFFIWRIIDTRTSDQTLCDALTAFIAGNDPADLKPGEWGYAYAKAHPDEAANAAKNAPAAAQRFNAEVCDKLGAGG